MAVVIGIPRETLPGERRVAMIPEVAKKLAKLGAQIHMERGAAENAHFAESAYSDVTFVEGAAGPLGADIVLKVGVPTEAEIHQMKPGAMLMCYLAPGKYPERVKLLMEKNITAFAMELVPRTTRGQSVDALSSQAAVSGYQASLMAAQLCPKFFPMLTTAAGTIRPAKALIIGAGVAGLQAIATARRLGAMVEAYDVRSATKEQVESLGAKFVSAVQGAEGAGGYARELSEEEKRQQQEVLAKHVAQADALITTAGVPGRPAPKIINEAMIRGMKPGSVIIDLMAEGGGNCEGTEPGQTVIKHGVTLHGPINVPSAMPLHASEMYSKNLLNFVQLIVKDGALTFDWTDELQAGMVYVRDQAVQHEASKKALGF